MTARSALADRVRAEYREMPGLKLTLAQACRLWQLDPATCDALLQLLVADRVLTQTSSGAYIASSNAGRSVKAGLRPPALLRRGA